MKTGFDGKLINPNNIKPGNYVVEVLPIPSLGSHGIRCFEKYPGLVIDLNPNKNMAFVNHGLTGGAVLLSRLRIASINDFRLGW